MAIPIVETGPTPLVSPAMAPALYPIEALGAVLADAARAIAAKVQCAEAMAAQRASLRSRASRHRRSRTRDCHMVKPAR